MARSRTRRRPHRSHRSNPARPHPTRPRRPRVDVSSYLIQLRESIARWLPSNSLPLIDGRRWSDRMLVIAAVLMAWAAGSTLGQRFAAARDAVVKMYPSRKRPGGTYEGFVAALTRRGPGLLSVLVGHLREQTRRTAEAHGCWEVGGRLAFAVDSTKLDLPMSRANEDEQAGFGVASKGGSWPQVLLGTLVHLGTGLPWSWRCAGARGSERDLLRTMLEDLPQRSLLLADAGFVGFDLMKSILACGHASIIRVGANVRLIEKLGYAVKEHDGIVYLWPNEAQAKGLSPLVLRRVTVVDGRNRKMVLLCSVLEASELSDAQAAELYRRRWGIELFYRTLKQTLGRGKLLSDCPEHAYAEAEWTMVGLWVLGLALLSERPAEAEADRPGPGPSVAMALRAVRDAMGGRIAPGRRDLRVVLRSCLKDAYVRRSAKAARHWPHKKRCKPPGEPLARMAEESEVELAQRLRSGRVAA
jgi:hypothetical protein